MPCVRLHDPVSVCANHARETFGVKVGKSHIPGGGQGLFATRDLIGSCEDNGNRDCLVVLYVGQCYLSKDYRNFPSDFTSNYQLTLPRGDVVIDAGCAVLQMQGEPGTETIHGELCVRVC